MPAAPRIGLLPSGPLDAITDVQGVRVGHCTLAHGACQTGVTVVLPPGDPFIRKPLAACSVLNGFGKSLGLLQLAELGCLETPIALGNTFAVPALAAAQIRQAVRAHSEIGRDWPTVNPLVLECNDGYLNDLQAMPVTEEHYLSALEAAATEFSQGSVGAGRGMSCFEAKGGIGSASRIAQDHTVGVLVLANFGRAEQCILAGVPIGSRLREKLEAQAHAQAGGAEKGSIIMILATDAPLDALQLGRLAKRCGNGPARTGSVFGHGSGDIAVAFTTANHLPWPAPDQPIPLSRLADSHLDPLFQAAAEATEQAILQALFRAERVTGRDGHIRYSLSELLTD